MFLSNNSFFVKIKRSFFFFLKEFFEEVIFCLKECVKLRCVVLREYGGDFWESRYFLVCFVYKVVGEY